MTPHSQKVCSTAFRRLPQSSSAGALALRPWRSAPPPPITDHRSPITGFSSCPCRSVSPPVCSTAFRRLLTITDHRSPITDHRSPITDHRPFTFIEVLAAVMILALGLVAVLTLLGTSSQRMEQSYTDWQRQHMVSQAAEYFLLAGPNSQIPREVFPYDDVTVSCSIMEPEALPDGLSATQGQWHLKTLEIRLNFADGTTETLKIDKILNDKNL